MNHHKKSSRIFAAKLMLFCTGNAVDDDVTVNRIFLVNPVSSLRSAVWSLQSAVCKCHTPYEIYILLVIIMVLSERKTLLWKGWRFSVQGKGSSEPSEWQCHIWARYKRAISNRARKSSRYSQFDNLKEGRSKCNFAEGPWNPNLSNHSKEIARLLKTCQEA